MAGPPVFVVGVPRSGTTLVRYVLNSGGHIFIPPESEFIPRFFGRRPRDPVDRAHAERLVARIFDEYRFVSQWRGERPTLTDLVGDRSQLTPAEFVDALYRRYAAQYGAARWGDKTPIHTNHLATIGAIFPDARIVHIVRDGRDVVASTIEKWSDRKRHVDPYFAARKWATRVGRARSVGRDLGSDHYLELRYERLVTDPEPVIRELCAFVGEPFSDAMLRPDVLARRQLAPGFHERVRHPITEDRIGRWRTDLPEGDQRIVESVAASQLVASGYQPEISSALTLGQRGRYAALVTKYAALQSGRRVLEAVGVFPPN